MEGPVEGGAGEPGDELEDSGYVAPSDDVIAEGLDAPNDPRTIYLEEASPYRPIATGDIFRGVAVAGATFEEQAHDLTMLVAHPSAMRKGAKLVSRARAASVSPVIGLSKRNWKNGFFNVFPLPRLHELASDNGFDIAAHGWGALLDLAGPIDTALLDVRNRVACLSPDGVKLLLQRLVHADTRVPVKTAVLERIYKPKLEELEMLEDWNEDIVAAKVDEDQSNLADELRAGAEDFETVMNQSRGEAPTLRELLERDKGAEARRILRHEIETRAA